MVPRNFVLRIFGRKTTIWITRARGHLRKDSCSGHRLAIVRVDWRKGFGVWCKLKWIQLIWQSLQSELMFTLISDWFSVVAQTEPFNIGRSYAASMGQTVQRLWLETKVVQLFEEISYTRIYLFDFLITEVVPIFFCVNCYTVDYYTPCFTSFCVSFF